MGDINQPSSHGPRKVHAENVNDLLRVWHEDLSTAEREVAIATARGALVKHTGERSGGRVGAMRNSIANKVLARCPDLTGRPVSLITKMVYAVWPESTGDPPRRPSD